MAPAFHVEIVVNDLIYQDVLSELDLSDNPPGLVLNHPGFATGTNLGKGMQAVRGLYRPGEHTVYVSNAHGIARERLMESTRHLLVTFLHELRHAHQFTHWTSHDFGVKDESGHAYWDSAEEVDARAWSEGAAAQFKGLIRISRRPVGGMSGLQRMSARAQR